MLIHTWINDDLITIETDEVWARTFAYWDALVPMELAERIATATEKELVFYLRQQGAFRDAGSTFEFPREKGEP